MNLSLACIFTLFDNKEMSAELVLKNQENPSFRTAMILGQKTSIQRDILYILSAHDKKQNQMLDLSAAIVINPDGIKLDFPAFRIEIRQEVDAYDIYEKVAEMFERYRTWEMQVMEGILENKSMQFIADSTQLLIRNPCYIMDSSLHILAAVKDTDLEEMSITWKYQYYHEYWPMEQMMSMVNTDDLASLKKLGHARIYLPAAFYMPCCGVAIQDEHVTYGYIFIIRVYDALKQSDAEMLNRLKELMLKYYTIHKEKGDLQSGMFYEHILIDIAKGVYPRNTDALKKQLTLMGWEKEHRFSVFTLDVDAQGDTDAIYLLNYIFTNEFHGKVFYLDGHFNCVFSRSEQAEPEKKIVYYLNQFDFHCGLSETFADLYDLGYYCNQAGFALTLGERINPAEWIHRYEDYFLEHIGTTLKQTLQKDQIWSSQIDRLDEYDKKHHTEYVNTLFQYLLEERSPTRTARKCICIGILLCIGWRRSMTCWDWIWTSRPRDFDFYWRSMR